MTQPLTIYGFWRSNATYRIRVALNIKGISYQEIPVDLDNGEQYAADFLLRNPSAAVPAVIVPGGAPITQSLAILEYIEELHPEPPLLPAGARARARVRAFASDVACDSHPLIVPRVKKYLLGAGFGDAEFREWQRHWITTGLRSIESKLAKSPETGLYCQGDAVTIADICLAGLAMAARLFKFEIDDIPTVDRIVDTCFALEAFARADPMKQSDAPKAS